MKVLFLLLITTASVAFSGPESFETKCELINSKSKRLNCFYEPTQDGPYLHIRIRDIKNMTKLERAQAMSLRDAFTEMNPRYCAPDGLCKVYLYRPDFNDSRYCDRNFCLEVEDSTHKNFVKPRWKKR